jgi:hypothetical protein
MQMNQNTQEPSVKTSFLRLGSKVLDILRQLLRAFQGYRVVVASSDTTDAPMTFESRKTSLDCTFQECLLRIVNARFQLVPN